MRGLLCIGAPRADLHADVSENFLKSFNLQPIQTIIAEESHKQLPKALVGGSTAGQLSLSISLGGTAALAALVAAGLARQESRNEESSYYGREKLYVTLIGGVGKDDMGRRLSRICRDQGIEPFLSETDSDVTGWRAVVRTRSDDKPVTDPSQLTSQAVASLGEDLEVQSRASAASIVSYSGASIVCSLDHVKRNARVWDQVTTCSIIYMDALFLTISPECTRYIAEHCAKERKVFALNLSARYICSYFRDKIMALLPYLDYIFGNEDEFMDLVADRSDMGTCQNIDETASWLAQIPRADGSVSKRRHIIATRGLQPTLVASTWKGEGVKVRRYPIPPVRAYRFTGKDGAGDAFAGGFLFGLMKEADLDSCVQMALYAAQVAVQRTKTEFLFKDKPGIERAEGPSCD